MGLGGDSPVLPTVVLPITLPQRHVTVICTEAYRHTHTVQVEPTRWLVDIRATTLAVLPLSTAGGAVRKAAVGALDARSILVEGDLIAVGAAAACCVPPLVLQGHQAAFFEGVQAEVQTVRADGQVQLHVRDAVASKLPPGMLVDIPAALVRPQRKHVHRWNANGGTGSLWQWHLCGKGICGLLEQNPAHPKPNAQFLYGCVHNGAHLHHYCPLQLQVLEPFLGAMEQYGLASMAPAAPFEQVKCRRLCRWLRQCRRWPGWAKQCPSRLFSVQLVCSDKLGAPAQVHGRDSPAG